MLIIKLIRSYLWSSMKIIDDFKSFHEEMPKKFDIY